MSCQHYTEEFGDECVSDKSLTSAAEEYRDSKFNQGSQIDSSDSRDFLGEHDLQKSIS